MKNLINNLQTKLLTGIVWAANSSESQIKEPGDIVKILNKIVNWAFAFLLTLAVIFIFYSAFLFLTAGGDTERISKAKKQLVWSIVAIVIALVAGGVRFIIENFINTGGSSPSLPINPLN